MQPTLRAADVMTRAVLSVPPDASLREAVETMLRHGVSGLLVVDSENRLAGIITEGDLLHRSELGTARQRPWWLRLVSSDVQAKDFVLAHGRYVRDVMTQDVLSVADSAPVSEVVALMEEKHIKRVPVLRDGRVAGIVSRADLLRALLAAEQDGPPAGDDTTIRERILATLQSQGWARIPGLNVTVTGGVAHIWGTLVSEQDRRALVVAAEATQGVTRVEDHTLLIEPFSGTILDPVNLNPMKES
jgi:CBS domain-containing protein